VLGNGEKVMAIPMETRLRAHPMVSAALLFGRGAEQVGFLIEPSEPIGVYDAEARSKFIEEIWYSYAVI
jgi:long-subunit acyl-CoA synthetase (AMP-forming)